MTNMSPEEKQQLDKELNASNSALKAIAASKAPSTISEWLGNPEFKRQLAMALPRHITSERMLRVFFTELKRIPNLKYCSLETTLGAMIQCAQLGLEPGAHLGHAYLLPYKNNKRGGQYDCQLIIGYKGMRDLVHRSGAVYSIDVHVVYESDHFERKLGLEPQLIHEPVYQEGKNAIRGVYAVATLNNGAKQHDYMTFAEIEKARSFSASGRSNYSPWITHYEEMAKKTVFRRLFKWLPTSVEMQRAIVVDEASERHENLMDFNDAIDLPSSDFEDSEPSVSKADEILKKTGRLT